jgi:hypothetical protein
MHMRTKALAKAIALLLLPGAAAAQEAWEGRVAVYGYFPDIGGHTRHAAPGGGEIDVDNNDLIRNTELAFMTSVEAQKGRWGMFGDLVFMDVGDEVAGATALGRGTLPVPPGIVADAAVTVEAAVLSFAANFRVLESRRNVFDAFAGIRALGAESTLDAALRSPLGPVATATSVVDDESVDAIVGVKGKVGLGPQGRWFLPYYVDVGTGDADRTSQAVLGIGFTTKRGEVFGTYRYLDYDMQNDSLLSDLELGGPAIGVAFRV